MNFEKFWGTAAKECCRITLLVGDQGFDLVHVPDVVLVGEAISRFTGFGVASISQFAVTMDGVVAAPLQFIADRSLASAGEAFYQVVPPAHELENTQQTRAIRRCGG